MNNLHPLFRWMNPYPDLVTVAQLTSYAHGLGFSALPIIKAIPEGQTAAEAMLGWATLIGVQGLAPGCVLAGRWAVGDSAVTLLYVKPLTKAAKALWLLTHPDTPLFLPSALSRSCPAESLTQYIRERVYFEQGCRPLSVLHAPWDTLEPCLTALLDAFQAVAIDPLFAAQKTALADYT